ncbi:unnamed protein product [Closterium sp. NIES-54]
MNGLNFGNVVGHSRAILKADLEHARDEDGNSDCSLVHEPILEMLLDGIGGKVVVECVDKFWRGGGNEDADNSSIDLLPLPVLLNCFLICPCVSLTSGFGRLTREKGLFSLAMVEEDILEVQSLHVTAQQVFVNPIAPCLEVGARTIGFKTEWGDGVGHGGRGEGHAGDPLVSRAKRRS